MALWSVVPLSIWWDGVAPGYFSGAWRTWGWGVSIVALLMLAVLAISKGGAAGWALRQWRRVMALPSPLFVALAAALFAGLGLVMCLWIFDGNPRNVDGFAQLFQARMFLAGRLWLPPPAELASFGTLQMILGPERWYSQYPYGQSLVLAAGLLAGAWWLLNPLFAAALAVATWKVARWACDEAAARLALVLLCLSPFAVAIAGSEMSHLPAATLAMTAAAMATSARGRWSITAGGGAGIALGLMTAFRPLDAVAAAVPVAIVLGGSDRRVAAFAGTMAGGVLASIPTLAWNAMTTGSWRRFGYEVLWGPDHSLGFHDVPFGTPLTLPRAIARSGMDLHQLNAYLLDTTIPVLIIVGLGFLAGRRLVDRRDAVPFAAVFALVAALFTYWHRDVFYGPRFLFSVIGWLLILVARAIVLLRRSSAGDRGPGAWAALGVAGGLAFGLITITPGRIRAYQDSTPMFALHPDRDARRAGISQAVVLIPDGWGSRLIARMWAAGIPVLRSTRLYAGIDACTLEQALLVAEADPASRATLGATLDSLLALNRPGQRLRLTLDPNLRLLPDQVLPEACAAQVEFDRLGFYAFGPWLYLNTATLDGDIVWARDLAADNGALFRRYAGRAFYRYAPTGPGGRPSFTPVLP